jgi:beta-phosphoglucomutase family hydrolase
MKKVKGAIFDMDGVVVDNHRYHFAAWMTFAQRHGFELNADIYREKYNGKTNADLFRMIFGDISETKERDLADEKEGLYQSLYRENMRPHTGLVEFLEYLQKERIKIALGTSAPTMNVDFTLDTLKLRAYFPVIVDGPQVQRGKPDPQVYQLCAARLGLEPRDCVVFEDSLAGLESGLRAGCHVIGVATSHQPYELETKTSKIIFDFTEARRLLETGF